MQDVVTFRRRERRLEASMRELLDQVSEMDLGGGMSRSAGILDVLPEGS